MDLRAKLAIALLFLLVVPFVVVTTVQVDRTMTVMAGDLADSGNVLINQTFEQIRTALSVQNGDPVTLLRGDLRLQSFLRSSQAFGKGVVYVRVEKLDGTPIITAAEGAVTGSAPPFSLLETDLKSWWPPTKLRALWEKRTYELSKRIDFSNRPAAVIRVGLSTALIGDEARRSIAALVIAGAVGAAIAVLGAIILGAILLGPIVDITAGVENIVAGREEVKIRVEGRNELSTLAERFNELSNRIKASRDEWETERGQFFNIFRSITDAVVLLDSNAAVLFANEEAQHRLGLPSGGQSEGKPLRMLVGADNPLLGMIGAARRAGTEIRDVALELSDGSKPSRALVSVFSLGRGPEPPGMLVVLRDLESVKELEDVMEYSGRLVRLGGLISGVAHQIRSPLNAMSLQLELLGQDAEHGAPMAPRLGAIRHEIERLDRTVDALMRFMRPQELKLAPTSLDDLLREVASQTVRHGIKVEYKLDGNLGSLDVDRALLAEALRNVISNAAEATPDGGAVTLSTRLCSDGFAEVSVSDEGPGIPEEDIPRIFNLYFTTKSHGNGLGLPLALRAIDLHHGTMDVQSKAGAGTTVTIRLPSSPVTRDLLGQTPVH
jgi:signal transduction histidine kinase